MARPRPAPFDKKKTVAENRRARFEYTIETVYEAGIALTGTEVKSLRFGEGVDRRKLCRCERRRRVADQREHP